jgi:hypothetical protein
VRRIAAVLGIVWALANVIVAAFFISSSFTKTTPMKEGILAQLALLIGGLLILGMGWLLAQQSWRLFRHRTVQ